MRWRAIADWLGSVARYPLRGGHRPAPGGRVRFAFLATALLLTWIAETLAKASLPLLLRDHPLLLIMLDARTHDLLLASPRVGVADFIVVGIVWRFGVHTLYYFLGRWYGDSALRWVTTRSRLGTRIAARVERVFGRFAGPAVFLLSDKVVCVVAGSAGMAPAWFLALHLSGTTLHIVVLALFAHSNQARLGRIADLIDRNAGWLTVVFVLGTIVGVIAAARLHRRGPTESGSSPAADHRTQEEER